MAEAKPLRARWRRFVDVYLKTWNQTEAARQVGFKHPKMAGSRLMTYDDVRAEIERQLEQKAMGKNETLARLAEQARNPAAEYLDDDGNFDFAAAREAGLLRLVKGVTKTDGEKSSGRRVELIDPQAALFKIGAHLQLFKDTEAPGVHLHIDGLGELISKAYGTNRKPDGPTEDSSG